MKKILALVCVLVMLMSLCAACGSSKSDEPAAEEAAPAAETATESDAEDTEEAPAEDAEEAPAEDAEEAPAEDAEEAPAEDAEEAPAEDAEEAPAEEEAALTTLEDGKLTISTSPDFPPYEFLDDDSNIVGIEPEILQLIADKLGLELVLDAMDFDSALLAVQQGKSDMVVSGCTVTEDRKLVMNFTDSYTTAKQVIVVPEGSDVTLDTLGDNLIGTQRGTTGFLYTVDDYGEDQVVGYDTYTLVFQALQNGQVDCVVLDDAVAAAYVAELPGLEILDTAYAIEDYAFGVDKNNAGLLDAVNGALKELMADGTVQSIIDSYISE